MATLLDQLILSRHDHDAFMALLSQHTNEFTPKLAAEANKRFREATDDKQFVYAAAAALTTSKLFLMLGQPYESLKNYIYSQQSRYMTASTKEAYQAIRDEGSDIAAKAEQIAAFDLVFEEAMLVANCDYFTANLQSIPEAKERWLRLTLDDLIFAASYGPHAKRPGLEQFVSLSTGFIEAFTPLVPRPSPAIEARLRQFTLAVEQFVPTDFQFQLLGDLKRSVTSARWLAVLSQRFGRSDIAKARFEFASGGQA